VDCELSEVKREVIRRLAAGQRGVDVARSMGMTPETVSRIRNSEAGRHYMAKLQADLDRTFVRMASAEAISRMASAMGKPR